MPRPLKVAAAQVGAVHLTTPKSEVVQRMTALLQQAIDQKVQLVVYPETSFTTFFPRHLFHSQEELDVFFEKNEDISQNEDVRPLFDLARQHRVDVCVGYAERCDDGKTGFNTCVYFSGAQGKVISKYRKVHLPGTVEPFPDPKAINQLEKRYFQPGNLGFQAFRIPSLLPEAIKKGDATPDQKTIGKGDPIAGMLICNDRRWPEAWRVYGLQGVELILCGFNTTVWAPDLFGMKKIMTMGQAEDEAYYHHKLSMEANSYMNSCFSISAARAGKDDGKYGLMGGSSVVNPQGHTIAQAKGDGDELVVADIDLEDCRQGKEKLFDFDAHRRIEAYGLIASQTGVIEPPLLD